MVKAWLRMRSKWHLHSKSSDTTEHGMLRDLKGTQYTSMWEQPAVHGCWNQLSERSQIKGFVQETIIIRQYKYKWCQLLLQDSPLCATLKEVVVHVWECSARKSRPVDNANLRYVRLHSERQDAYAELAYDCWLAQVSLKQHCRAAINSSGYWCHWVHKPRYYTAGQLTNSEDSVPSSPRVW